MSNTYRKELDWYYDFAGNRDSKKWFKPNKKFKQLQKKSRKAKEKDALKHILENEDEILPKFPKTDVWDWN